MAFLYFLPGPRPLSAAELRASPIGYAFDSAALPVSQQTLTGPDGRAGVVYADSRRQEKAVRFLPELQRWQKLPGVKAFAGLFHDDLPEPSQLERARLLDGYHVELADGRRWQIPRAYEFTEPETDEDFQGPSVFRGLLPKACSIGEDGRWNFGPVLQTCAALWELANDWGAVRFGQADERQKERFDFDGQISAAILALAQNYVVGPAEASLLGLITIDHARETLDAVIDRRTFDALAKKKRTWWAARLSAAGSPGPADSPLVGDAPSPITNS